MKPAAHPGDSRRLVPPDEAVPVDLPARVEPWTEAQYLQWTEYSRRRVTPRRNENRVMAAVDLTAIATGMAALLAAIALGARYAGRTAPHAAPVMAGAGVGR